jgi:hypothetical protein
MLAQATAQSKAEIYPESETEYFYTLVYAQITFVKNRHLQKLIMRCPKPL